VWGTLWTVVCVIANLPPGSEAASKDISEAYCLVPIHPDDWPALVVCAPGKDRFCVDTCLCFGAVPGDGLFGKVMDGSLTITQAHGIGPILPWVDDQILFRICTQYLQQYNKLQAKQAERIRTTGGTHKKGAQRWWTGGTTPSGQVEEFGKDMQYAICDLSNTAPHSEHNKLFTYMLSDYKTVAKELGMVLNPPKRLEFAPRTKFIGLEWEIQQRTIALLAQKRDKYHCAVCAILDAPSVPKHNAESVFGKLQHASVVLPAGRTYLVNLLFNIGNYSSSFAVRWLSQCTQSDIEWWHNKLSTAITPQPLPYATELWEP
jgi:hypothetical protein